MKKFDVNGRRLTRLRQLDAPAAADCRDSVASPLPSPPPPQATIPAAVHVTRPKQAAAIRPAGILGQFPFEWEIAGCSAQVPILRQGQETNTIDHRGLKSQRYLTTASICSWIHNIRNSPNRRIPDSPSIIVCIIPQPFPALRQSTMAGCNPLQCAELRMAGTYIRSL